MRAYADSGLRATVSINHQNLVEYEKLVQEYGLHVMDAVLPVELQQRQLRETIQPLLADVARLQYAAR